MTLLYDDLAVFVAIAREGSFRGAAKRLELPVSSVSRRLAGLEARLRTPLLRRTTRAVSLTAEGEVLFSRCLAAFGEIDMAREAVQSDGDVLRGRIAVTAPPIVCTGRWALFLLRFAEAHPELALDLRLTNAEPDLVEEGIDVSFQLGPLRDSGHMARRLWAVRSVLCAGRTLVDRMPELLDLDHPESLADVPAVVIASLGTWIFEKAGKMVSFNPKRVGASVSEIELGGIAIARGLGVSYVPEGLVHERLGKEVVPLPLGGWRPVARDLYAVYLASRQLNPKVRALIDYVVSGDA